MMLSKKFKIAALLVSTAICGAVLFAAKTVSANKDGKTFGDWKIACQKDDKTKKTNCLIQQTVSVKQDDKEIPVATYQFVYKDKKDLKLVEILPQGILLQPGTSIIVDEEIIGKAQFTVCQNGGCVAVADISDGDLEIITGKESVAVGMFNGEGKQANLVMSTKGLKEGLADLKN